MINREISQIQKITDTVVKNFQPDEIILFGSWASGNQNPESDVDICIVKKTDKRPIERELELRRILFGHRFPPLDLLIYTPEEVKRRLSFGDFFLQDIIQNGTSLYVR